MQNYDKVLEYTNKTMEASGTSAQKYTHYMDSLQAKINELTVQWEEFIQGLNQGGTIKIGVSLLSNMLSVLDALTNKAPILQNVVGSILLFKGLKSIIPSVLSFKKNITGLITTFVKLKASNPFTAFKEADSALALSGQTLSRYQKYQIMLITSSKKLTLEKKKDLLTQQGLTAAQAESVLGITSLNAVLEANNIVLNENQLTKTQAILADKNLAVSTKATQIAEVLLGKSVAEATLEEYSAALAQAELITSNYSLAASGTTAATAMTALNVALGVISLVAMGVVTAVMAQTQATEEAKDKAVEATNAYNEQASSLDEVTNKYKELYRTLQSTKNLDDTVSTKQELLDLQKDIVDQYGEQAKGIDLVNGNLDIQLKKLKEIAKENARERLQNPEYQSSEIIDWMTKSTTSSRRIYEQRSGGSRDALRPQLIALSDEIKELLPDIAVSGVGGSTSQGEWSGSFSMNIELTGTPEQKINQAADAIDRVNEAIANAGDNTELIKTLTNIRDEYYNLKNEIENDDYYKLSETIPETIATEAGKSELLQEYKDRISQLEQFAFTDDKTITDVVTNQEISYDKFISLLQKNYNDFNSYIYSLSGKNKVVMQDYFNNLVTQYQEAIDKNKLKQILSADNILSDEDISTLKENTADIIAEAFSGGTQDGKLVPILDKIKSALGETKYEAEDLADVLTALGYVWTSSDMPSAADLISGFPTDEKAITNMVDNIEKMNNAIKALESGTTPDIGELQELKTAGYDITAFTKTDLSNLAEWHSVRQKAVQEELDSYDQLIANAKKTMEQDKEMTDNEKTRIEQQIQYYELAKTIISNSVEGIKTTASEYLTTLNSANEILAQLSTYGNTRIGEDVLSSMTEQYSGMTAIVEKYRMDLIDNDELIKAFEDFYKEDINNYQEYQNKKYMGTSEYYNDWIKENEDWVEDFKDKYGIDLKNYQTYTEAKAAIEKSFNRTKEIESTYDFGDYVDENFDYTEAGKAFVERGMHEPSIKGVTDVLQEYVELKKESIKAAQELDKQYTEDTKDAYVDMAETADKKLTVITDRMQNAYSLLHELQTNNTQLTIENLNSMKSAYPAMTEYIDKYLRKEMTRQELVSKFKELYEQDKTNYKNAQIEKLSYSSDFYKNAILGNKNLVKKFDEQYHIDLKNFATITAAKQAILDAFNDENAAGFALNIEEYINLATGEYSSAFEAMMSGEHMPTGGLWITPYVQALHDILGETGKAAEDTADSIVDTIEKSVYSVEDALSDISTVLSKQVEYYEDIANGIVAAAQLEIDALDKEIDLLDKKNEAQQRQIALQEKLEALNKAKTQRSVREYNAETGQFEWTTNKKDIKKAQQEYDQQLEENRKQDLEDSKEWLEKYGESFSNIPETIQNQRDVQSALTWLAQYRGVNASTLSAEDLLNLTEKEQEAYRSRYGKAVDINLGFEDAQSQKELNKAKSNLVLGGYATNGENGFAFDWKSITTALGTSVTTLATSLDKYAEILKPTSFAETKPTTNMITNVTNTGEVKNNYTFTGDMEFKFDKNVDAESFWSEIVTKIQNKNGITTVQ